MKTTRNNGFTLIELLVTIAIIAILASFVLAAVSHTKAAAKSAWCKSNLHQLGVALAMYVTDHGAYPVGDSTSQVSLQQATPRNWVEKNWYGNLMLYCSSPIPPADAVFTYETLYPPVFLCPNSPILKNVDQWWFWSGRLIVNITNQTTKGVPFGYNMVGSSGGSLASEIIRNPNSDRALGLGLRCKESDVIAPSDMIAISDASTWHDGRVIRPCEDVYSQYRPAGWHNDRVNVLFTDAHIETIRSNTISAPTELARSRWNKDNKPHAEFW